LSAQSPATTFPIMAGSSLYRLQKEKRLLSAAAVSRVFKKATRSRDKWFTVLYRANEKDVARLGLAISKKNCRYATGRNRIKRVVRESFRRHQASLSGLDMVVMNQPAAGAAGNQQLFDSMAGHWRRCQQARDDEGAQER
jgi:ribonuclease P protein component